MRVGRSLSKTITDNQILGERGVNFVQRVVLEMEFTWHPSNQPVEAGIDGWVELRNAATGEVANSWVAVQSKAVTEISENETHVKFSPKKKDVEYWLQGTQPIVLVLSQPDQNRGWWVSVKDYYAGKNIDKDRVIAFDKESQQFTPSVADEFRALSSQAGDGAYFTPVGTTELLTSNLVKVWRWGEIIYSRMSKFKEAKDIAESLRNEIDKAPREWIYAEGNIYSFHDLSKPIWGGVCEGDTDSFNSDEWAFSDESTNQRNFVRLLNSCMREFVWQFFMRYSKDEECFYFLPSRQLDTNKEPIVERKVTYQSREKKTRRSVVTRYMHKVEKNRIAYYRHTAFSGRFLRFGSAWFLMIEPTYVFTTDGKELAPFREELKSGIKKIEGDNAVSGTVVMFRELFHHEKDLFSAYPFLSFDEIVKVEVGAGIDDAAWRRIKKEDDEVHNEANADFAKGLFD